MLERPQASVGRALELLDNLALLIGAAAPQVEGLTAAGDVRRVEPSWTHWSSWVPRGFPRHARRHRYAPRHSRLHRTARRALVTYQQPEVDVRIVAPDEYGTALQRRPARVNTSQHCGRGKGRPGSMVARRTSMRTPACRGSRRSSATVPERSKRRRPGSCRRWSSARRHPRRPAHAHDLQRRPRPLDAMVQRGRALGYEYIAITDHSERAAASRTLTRRDLRGSATRSRGCASDIRRSDDPARRRGGHHAGRPLDFPDAVLEPLDIVLASLHDSAGHDRDAR